MSKIFLCLIICMFYSVNGYTQCTFSYTPTTSCDSTIIDFEVDNPVPGSIYSWEPEPGITLNGDSVRYDYPLPGFYNVFLIENGNICNVQFIEVKNTTAGKINVSNLITCGQVFESFNVVNPNPNAVYEWDFNDSTQIETGSYVTHAFPSLDSIATYNVTLSENGITCGSVIITVESSPDASIDFPSSDCNGNMIVNLSVTNTSNTTNTSVLIDWGDGFSEPLPPNWTDTTHTYTSTGFFTITLTVGGNYNCPTAVEQYSFFNGSNPAVGLGINGSTNKICTSDTLYFDISNTELNPNETIYEVFSGGQLINTFNHPPPDSFPYSFPTTSCGQQVTVPPITYQDAFDVTIIASNPCFTSAAQVAPIRVSGTSTAAITVDDPPFCVGDSTEFQNASTASIAPFLSGCGGEPVSGIWSIYPPTGWTGDLTEDDITITFDSVGTYTIEIVSEACGVLDTATTEVTITTPPIASVVDTLESIICSGESLTFQNTSTGNSLTYEWQVSPSTGWVFNGTSTSDSSDVNIMFVDTGTYVINMIAENACDTAIWIDTVHVISPIVEAGIDTSFCESDTLITLNPGTPAGGIWSGTGIVDDSLGTFNPSMVTSSPVILTYSYIDTLTGCLNSDSLSVIVDPEPIVDAGGDLLYCTNTTPEQLPSATPPGGTWTGGTINPTMGTFDISQLGSDTMIYTYISPGGCIDTDTVIVTVTNVVDADAGVDVFLGIGQGAYPLNGIPVGGNWTGPGVSSSGVFYSNSAGTGVHQLIYSIGSGTCQSKDTLLITVMSISYQNLVICESNPSINLNGLITLQPTLVPPLVPTTGLWTGTGVNSATSTFTPPNVTTTTNYTLNYAYPTDGQDSEINLTITVDPDPEASFSPIIDPCVGSDVDFLNTSIGADTYEWDLGDGSPIVTLSSFSHTYTVSDTYTVVMTATNSASGCKDTVSQTFFVSDPAVASFGVSPTSGCTPLTVSFTNQSTGDSLSYNWDFDNGQTSTLANPPPVVYPAPLVETTYNIILTVSNQCNTETVYQTVVVTPDVQAQFIAPSPVCSGDSFQLNNFSYGEPTNFSWYLDGVFFSADSIPTQTLHAVNGVVTDYDVTLVASNGCGSDTVSQILTVNPSTINAVFSMTDPAPCEATPIQFTSFGPANATYAWDFGDGGLSTLASPNYTFNTPGSYVVQLEITGECSSDTSSQIITVLANPVADFTTSITGCENTPITFTNTSINNSNNLWDFGDFSTSNQTSPSHSYTSAGTYTVTLIVANVNGCKDTTVNTILIDTMPTTYFSFVDFPCEGDPVSFNASPNIGITAYNWDFGDSNGSSQANPIHSYSPGGTYTVNLEVTDANGCKGIYQDEIHVNDTPTADFSYSILDFCAPETITFTNNSQNAAGHSWDFGDGNTSTLVNPTHTYSTMGVYQVVLNTLNATCMASDTQTITIYEVPQIDFSVDILQGCGPLTASFTNLSTTLQDSITFMQWDFGDGNFSFDTNPVHTYLNSGIYDVVLIGNTMHCKDSTTVTITVFEPVSGNISATDPTCAGSSNGSLLAAGAFGTPPYVYLWSNGAKSGLNPNLSAGNYSVTISDINNCEIVLSASLSDPTPISISINPTSVACFGDSTGSFNTTVIGGTPPYNYYWDNAPSVPNPTGLPSGSYQLTVEDSFGCFRIETSQIAQHPQLDAFAIGETLLCNGDTDGDIDLTVSGGVLPYVFDWDLAPDVEDPSGLGSGVYQVTITDNNLCTTTSTATITEPTALGTNMIGQIPQCHNGADGAITLTVTGGTLNYSYLWSNGDTTQHINNITAGMYSVTITDANGCNAYDSFVLSQPQLSITYSITTENVTCVNGNDGSALLLANGGTPPYSYSWNTGVTGPLLDSVPAGQYAFVITDANGCWLEDTLTIYETPQIELIDSVIQISCYGYSDGVIYIDSIQGGQEPYLLSLEPDFSDSTWIYSHVGRLFQNLSPGDYTIYVMDSNGCSDSINYTFFDPFEVTVDLEEEVTIRLGDSIPLIPFIQLPNLTFDWFPTYALSCTDCQIPVASPKETTTYTLTVSDSLGCQASDQIKVIVDVDQNVFIPNVFTPNNDGVNDIFMIYSDPWVKNVKAFRIYDRWGELVWQQNNFQPNNPDYGWNGDLKGKKMQPGVFVYYAEIEFFGKNTPTVYTGDVTLLK